MKISPARVAAFDVLLRIERDQAFSSVLLPETEEVLLPQDRGLCHELVLGSLRKQLYLDRLISVLTKDRKLDAEVLVALRLAIYQLKFLDRIPPHSAVNESVNLVNRAKKSSARPFVNAILRRLIRENVEIQFADDIDRLSVETSHPRWLLEKWIADLGLDISDSIARANNVTPPPAFRLIGQDVEVGNEIVSGLARRSESVPDCYLADRVEPRLLELFRNGKVYFQDQASQMVAHAVEVKEGDRVLDVCASPGGKTTIISRKALKAGGSVFAGDVSRRRVELLKETVIRLGEVIEGIVQYDASTGLPFQDRSFDHVLVDAPCSGTGTIRHNPELRYFVTAADIGRFVDKQLSILISASEMVRPGGQLVYSTCSLEIEENEGVCRRFIEALVGFVPITPKVPSNFLTPLGYARTRPDRDGMDGFFIAGFRRK